MSLRKSSVFLISFLLLKIVLQYLLINPVYELHRDEYLHLDQGSHLAWGFVSVPPATAFFSMIIKALGNSVFWVKFFPALFGALTILTVWYIVEEIGGSLFAQVLAALALLLSVLLRLNILYQPNSLDTLCWALVYYALIKYLNTRQNKWLCVEAIIIAIGFLNKYSIVFLVIGLLPPFLLSDKKVVANKHLYFSLLLLLGLLLPNIIWQFQHQFPVIHHMQELAATQLVHVDRFDFIKGQVLFFFNSFFLVLLAFTGFLFYPPFKKYRPIAWGFLITVSLFTFLRAKDYYAIGLYPVLIGFGAVYLEKISAAGWRRYLKPVSILIIILLFLPVSRIAFPVYTPQYIEAHAANYSAFGMLRWEDGKQHALPQDFADMQGWKELASKVQATYDTITDKEHTLIICDNYGQAGAINYYTKGRVPPAVSYNADYINWMNLEKPLTTLIIVKDEMDENFREAASHTSYKKVGVIENPYAREKGAEIYWMRSNDYINNLLRMLLRERKK